MTTEAEFLDQIFGGAGDSLREELPCGYTILGKGRNDEVDALLDVPVLRTHSTWGERGRTYPQAWDGPEKVEKWYELANGKKVGWIMNGEWQFIVR